MINITNMKISVELTLTPLQDDYETPIIAFIKKLRASGLKVLELEGMGYDNFSEGLAQV